MASYTLYTYSLNYMQDMGTGAAGLAVRGSASTSGTEYGRLFNGARILGLFNNIEGTVENGWFKFKYPGFRNLTTSDGVTLTTAGKNTNDNTYFYSSISAGWKYVSERVVEEDTGGGSSGGSSSTKCTVRTWYYDFDAKEYYIYRQEVVNNDDVYPINKYAGYPPKVRNGFNMRFYINNGTTSYKELIFYYYSQYKVKGWTNSEPDSITGGYMWSGDGGYSVYIASGTTEYDLYPVFSETKTDDTNVISYSENYPGFSNGESTTKYTATFYEDGVANGITRTRTIKKGLEFLGWAGSKSGSVLTGSKAFYKTSSLYAKWGTDTVTTSDTYDNNTLPSPKTLKSDKDKIYSVTYETNSDYSLSGTYAGIESYTFDGWYNKELTSPYGKPGDVFSFSSNISIYSKWSSNISPGDPIKLPSINKSPYPGSTYTVTIDPDNGEYPTSSNVSVGKKVYTFAGWYEDSNFTKLAGDTGAAGSDYYVNKTITLYAKWDEETISGINIYTPNTKGTLTEDAIVTLDFHTNSISNSNLSSIKTTTYRFNGWYIGNTPVTSLTPYIPTADVTIKAKWNPSSNYTSVDIPSNITSRIQKDDMIVKLHNNYGDDSINVYSREKVSIFNLLGYFNQESGGSRVCVAGDSYTPSNLNTTLHAQWELDSSYVDSIELNGITRNRIDGKEYIVYYNGKGGEPERGSDVIVRGRINYTFDGWYDNKQCTGNPITSPYKPVQPSIDFYAKWIEEYVNEQVKLPNATRENSEGTNATVTFDPDGGLVLGSETATKSVSVGGKRYRFEGWYDNINLSGIPIGFTGDNYYPSDSDDSIINLYAKWDEDIDDGSMDLPIPTKQLVKEYTVKLNAGGGLIGTSNEKNLIARNGTLYKFNGWYDGATKIESPYSPTDNITLKARWLIDSNVNEPITFETPVFNTSKSININLYENKNENDTTKTVKTATKVTKKDFKGWYLDNERLDSSSNTYMPSRDGITITARWDNAKCDPITIPDKTRATETKNYTINLNSNGGTIDTGVNALSASRSTEYVFTGWYESRRGNNTMTDSNKQYTPDPDSTDTEINMYAHWNANPTTVRANLPSATMNGYTHLGWSTDRTKQNLVASPYVPVSIDVESVTLYAIYSYKGKIKINGKYYMPIVYHNSKWYKLLPEVFKNGSYKESGYKE